MAGAGSSEPVTPATARALAFVDDLDRPRLNDADHHHLARVLRLSPGDAVAVGDGAGRWRPGRLTAGPEVEATGEVVVDARPEPEITVGFALVKGDRPELAVQKLTELGVDRIVPFTAERSVVRWDEAKAARQGARLREIARGASMQCRRTRLPEVDALSTFGAAACLPGAALAERDGEVPSLRYPTVLVGPEGGWGPAERSSGLPHVVIATHIVRSETAAFTVGALLVALRSQIVTEGTQNHHMR